ncbi:homogentisate phytyltransferase 1 [Citrus sinensis]|nr:homogentisate phytyltransferase 1 [Citrus sinensis]
MMNRYHKPLKKSTVPMALQDDSATKSQNENIVSTSFLDFLTKKLDAFYRLSRPYAWTSIIVGILSSSLLPIQSLADLTPTFLIEVLKPIVPTIMMNIFVVAINQLSDIAIDKSLAMGVMLRSPPLVIALILRCILGAAYSIHLPLLRWKASPLMAAVAIVIGNGINNVLPSFLHVQKYVLGRPVVFTKPLLFAVAFSAIFSIVLSLLKDIPDVEGDKKSGIRTLPVILGKERVLSMSTGILLMAYASAALAGVFSPILLCKLVTQLLKYPQKSKITKLHLYCEIIEIPLPVNGHRNSTDGDGKLRTESSSHAESNGGGGDLPLAVVAPDRAPEVVNPSTADQWQNDVPGVSG